MIKRTLSAMAVLSLATASQAFVYLYDDGVTDSQLTTSGPATFNVGYLTQFTVASGAGTLTSVDIVWGARTFPNLPNGLSADVLLMSDPNNDGNPNDAAILRLVNTTTVGVGSDAFHNYAVAPLTLTPGTSFFAGAFIRNVPTGSAWIGLDDDATGRSNNNWWNVVISSPVGPYNSLGLFGNPNFTEMTRVNAVPEPATMTALALGTLALLRRRRKP